MSDTKELTWGDAARSAVSDDSGKPTDEENSGAGEQSSDSWETYRKWLSHAPAPPSKRRQIPDRSVYTWKGYRSWSDRVKRSWIDRKDNDSD